MIILLGVLVALVAMHYGAAAVAIISTGVAVYEGEQNRKAANKNKPKDPPPPPTLPDESPLNDQRKKRLLSATGRDGTILAPVGINGSPLGGASSAPGSVPAKTTLGG